MNAWQKLTFVLQDYFCFSHILLAIWVFSPQLIFSLAMRYKNILGRWNIARLDQTSQINEIQETYSSLYTVNEKDKKNDIQSNLFSFINYELFVQSLLCVIVFIGLLLQKLKLSNVTETFHILYFSRILSIFILAYIYPIS